jgi:hypothetical protein
LKNVKTPDRPSLDCGGQPCGFVPHSARRKPLR